MRVLSSMARVAVVLLLATACGESTTKPPEPPSCGPMSCDGCCSAGTCQPGTSVLACGKGGAACSACGAGASCDEGTCTQPSSTDGGGEADAGTDAGADGTDAGTGTDGGTDAGTDAGTDGGASDAGPQHTFILFDPRGAQPVIPEPNDELINPDTGLVQYPVSPNDSPAQQEFTRDYLNTSTSFPETSTATVQASAPLDPASVNSQSVRVWQLFGPGLPQNLFVAYNDDTRRINVVAPTGWGRGGYYAVVVLGGDSGVRDAAGQRVVGSPVWQWVLSKTPLVDDSGRSTVPGLSDADAPNMERLRRRYGPFVDDVEDTGVPRQDVLAFWLFYIGSESQVTFDPFSGVTPFPSNLYLSADGTRLNLPAPPSSAGPLMAETITGLNKLDGFSTSAVIVSENSPTLGALDASSVNPGTLAAGTRFFRLGGAGEEPSVVACLNCASSPHPETGPQVRPQQLQFVPQLPLSEGTTYAAVVTTDLEDLRGNKVRPSPTWALLRLAAPLVDDQGRSQVARVPDALARALEPIRLSLKPALDELEARGLPRRRIALATVFRTQSTLSALHRLTEVARTAPTAPAYVRELSHELPSTGVPHDQLGGLYEAAIPVANLLTGPGGTIDTTPPREEQARMFLTVPASAMPEAGWPVVLFAHELRSDRRYLLPLANELARVGFAAVSLDAVHHGERSHCVGSSLSRNDDEACEDPSTQRCESNPTSQSHGRCVARDPSRRPDCSEAVVGTNGDQFCSRYRLGRCISESEGRRVCEGGAFRLTSGPLGQPSISGWNMFNPLKPFAARDNMRQAAVDLGQLVRVLRGAELASALGDVKLDTTRLHFVGVGMGAMVGSLFLAANNDVQRAVLNVPAADPLGWLLTSPTLINERQAYLSALHAQGLVQGTPAFDAFIQYQRQALDPADPWNMARASSDRAGAPAERDVFIQYISRNDYIPTPLTERFIAAANAGDANRCPVSQWVANGLPDFARPGFLLYRFNGGAVTDAAQRQAAGFLATGTVEPEPLPSTRWR